VRKKAPQPQLFGREKTINPASRYLQPSRNRNCISVVGRDQTRQPILLNTRRAVRIGKRSDCR
jgi:hypothetical protein